MPGVLASAAGWPRHRPRGASARSAGSPAAPRQDRGDLARSVASLRPAGAAARPALLGLQPVRRPAPPPAARPRAGGTGTVQPDASTRRPGEEQRRRPGRRPAGAASGGGRGGRAVAASAARTSDSGSPSASTSISGIAPERGQHQLLGVDPQRRLPLRRPGRRRPGRRPSSPTSSASSAHASGRVRRARSAAPRRSSCTNGSSTSSSNRSACTVPSASTGVQRVLEAARAGRRRGRAGRPRRRSAAARGRPAPPGSARWRRIRPPGAGGAAGRTAPPPRRRSRRSASAARSRSTSRVSRPIQSTSNTPSTVPARGRSAGADSVSGSTTWNRVSPGSDTTRRSPPCRLTTTRHDTSSPSPVPCPTGLVVKNGSKTRDRSSARDAGAGVADLHQRAVAVPGGPERQRALAGHRVEGVDDQVGPHLVELAGVGGHLRQARGRTP